MMAKMSVSEIRLVKMTITKAIVKVFPNPAKDDVYIQLQNYIGNKLHIQLSDISGKVFFSNQLTVQSNGNYKLPLIRKPATGIYTVQITGDNINETIKLIIQ